MGELPPGPAAGAGERGRHRLLEQIAHIEVPPTLLRDILTSRVDLPPPRRVSPAARAFTGAPLDAGRKAGAAPPAQARLHDLLDRNLRTKRQRSMEALEAAVRDVVVRTARVDHAAARKGEPRLPLEERNLLREPDTASAHVGPAAGGGNRDKT